MKILDLLFPKPQVKFTVVELEKHPPLVETIEVIDSVRTLSQHPGFQWLVQKLDLQAALLKSALENTHHESLETVRDFQSGIKWCHWLQGQVDFAHKRWLSMRPPTRQEEDILAAAQIELIGSPTQSA